MAKKKELEAGIHDLEDALRRLAVHAEVVALAVRSPERVPEPDLDGAIAGIHELTLGSRANAG
jgi:hypothetical protein